MGISALLFPALSLAYRDDKGLVWMAVIGVLLGMALWLVLTPLLIAVAYVLSFFSARTLVRNNPSALGPVTYQFSERGYAYSAPNGKGETLWTAFPRIHETRENFLFFFVKHLATVVPKRYFLGQPAIHEFRDLLKRNYQGEMCLSASQVPISTTCRTCHPARANCAFILGRWNHTRRRINTAQKLSTIARWLGLIRIRK